MAASAYELPRSARGAGGFHHAERLGRRLRDRDARRRLRGDWQFLLRLWRDARPAGCFDEARPKRKHRDAAWLGAIAELPVNGDLADGFGPAPEDCAATVEASVAAGLAGLGIEDATGDPAPDPRLRRRRA